MSLLGFDAPGRLALGQLPRIGLTNTVLPAATATLAVAAQIADFATVQSCTGGIYALAGNAAAARISLTGLSSLCSVVGIAAGFPIAVSANTGGFVATGTSSVCIAKFAAPAAAYVLNGNTAVLGSAIASFAGFYALAGFATTFTRDFAAWFPRPFEADDWTPESVVPAEWTDEAASSALWTVKTTPAETWTPVVGQSKTWAS